MKIINKTLVFVECNVMNVTIPDSVTSIDDFAFSDCRNFTNIKIPDNVTSIGISAFSRCINLTSITIPDGITSIGKLAFYGCTSLRYNTYDNAQYLGNAQNPYLVLVKATAKDITSCAIHARAKIIYGSAFYGCTGLTSITIPNSVTSIGNYAFYNCTGLTSITIPDNVTGIGEGAFSGCTGLTSVTISDSVTSIGDWAFYNCTGLTSITIGNGVTSIGRYAFDGCTGLPVNTNKNYKAFIFNKNHGLMAGCKNKKYRIGHKSFARGALECCNNGLHYCTNPFDIFNYYYGDYEKDFVVALCDVSPENVSHKDDSKRCARWIRPTKILTREELIALLNNPIKGGEK